MIASDRRALARRAVLLFLRNVKYALVTFTECDICCDLSDTRQVSRVVKETKGHGGQCRRSGFTGQGRCGEMSSSCT